MVMALDLPRAPDTGQRSAWWRLPRLRKADGAFNAVLSKKDDRLLTDAGLTREEALGPEGYFWGEWLRIKEPWAL